MWDHFPLVPSCPSPGSRLEPSAANSSTLLCPSLLHILIRPVCGVSRTLGDSRTFCYSPLMIHTQGTSAQAQVGVSVAKKKKIMFFPHSLLSSLFLKARVVSIQKKTKSSPSSTEIQPLEALEALEACVSPESPVGDQVSERLWTMILIGCKTNNRVHWPGPGPS